MKLLISFTSLLLTTGMTGQLSPQQATTTGNPISPAWPVDHGAYVVARLSTPLKAGKAKIGDRVAAKLLDNYVRETTIIAPRASLILGHVTEVQKRSKSNRESRLGFTFDQIRLPSGKIVPFEGRIVSVHPYFTRYEQYQQLAHAPCINRSNGECLEVGEAVVPDYYNLESTSHRSDGAHGIILTSGKHNINLGWDVQFLLRLP